MTTINHVPPALPQGAASCTEWQLDGDELYRLVYTDEESIDGRDLGVYLCATQHPDGTLSGDDPQEIYLHIAGDGPLSGAQSRALAQILLDAAEQADRWTALQSMKIADGHAHSPAWTMKHDGQALSDFREPESFDPYADARAGRVTRLSPAFASTRCAATTAFRSSVDTCLLRSSLPTRSIRSFSDSV